ncbi:MAG: DNA adenine methylase [Ruminococcus sp.]|nr:DNA adenine methylase [Ruminococcus sp.]MEE1318737.1 DNA adenine methylase [Ruminococcus sp.]
MNIRTPVSWVGNKTSILPIIYAMFPIKYERYIEPFGGSGAVLLGKEKADDFEVYNDVNRNLVNLFKCMRDRPNALIKELGFLNLNARDDFNSINEFFKKEEFDDKYLNEELELTKVLFNELSAKELIEIQKKIKSDYDLRRASMFLKLLRYSYASSGKSFASQPFDIRSLFSLIEQVGKRLTKVVIENQDFEVLIKHYDRECAFFYCDPPYVDTEHFYTCEFTLDHHLRLRDSLMNIKGYFLLSYNDCEEVREWYKDCCFYRFTRPHSMAQRYEPGKQFHEILIANYDLEERRNNLPKQLNLFDLQETENPYEEVT